MADAATEAAMGLIEDLGPEDAPDAPQQPEAEGAEQTPEQEVDEFDMELPADLAAEMEAPVYDEEQEEPELEAEYEEPDEYEDPAVSEVKAQNRKLSKQLAWEKEQRLKQSRKQWIDKDSKYFPLADTKAIAERTTSRREFAREAKAENDRIKALPGVQKLLAAKGGAQTEGQAEAWGTPTTGSGLVPSESAEIQAQIDKARATKGFRGAVTEMLKTGKVSI